jgi:hypothetical protein
MFIPAHISTSDGRGCQPISWKQFGISLLIALAMILIGFAIDSARASDVLNRMADDEVSIQNSAIVQLGADLCGYRITERHREAMNYIFRRNESRFNFYYQQFQKQTEKWPPQKLCNDLRTDDLARMYEPASMAPKNVPTRSANGQQPIEPGQTITPRRPLIACTDLIDTADMLWTTQTGISRTRTNRPPESSQPNCQYLSIGVEYEVVKVDHELMGISKHKLCVRPMAMPQAACRWVIGLSNTQ